MRHRRPHQPRTDHPNVVPLIDVMLCIIVFYMLAAKIGVASGVDESIELPVSVLGKQLREEGSTNTLILNVRESAGLPLVTAAVDAQSAELVQLPVEDFSTGTRPLTEVLRRLRLGSDGVEDTADDNLGLRVVIRGQTAEPTPDDPSPGTLTYRALSPVLLAINDAGISNVGFMTRDAQRVVGSNGGVR